MDHSSFFALERAHDQLTEDFLLHQEALLDFDWPRAMELFQWHRRALELHMKQENEWLLPLFERIGDIKRWPAKLYYGEHRKMIALLDKIQILLDDLAATPPPAKRKLLRVLELETTFKHLGEHHHIREHESFFPVLDQVTSDEEKQHWLQRCLTEWYALRRQAPY